MFRHVVVAPERAGHDGSLCWVPLLGAEEEEASWSTAVCNSSAWWIIPMSFHTPMTMLVSHTE
ncbi:hypothetical protein NXT3_PC00334 (plasmid) [Sinorhizobium fredii]|uniref:Uncharacterized protein n=1 Tax=Rhizobium fredii TaxID=380 RepID=A0A2L0HDG0_RHIFR|nr:hypothetical protein NXT3_PC00334 [Sinorhizobium fredii]